MDAPLSVLRSPLPTMFLPNVASQSFLSRVSSVRWSRPSLAQLQQVRLPVAMEPETDNSSVMVSDDSGQSNSIWKKRSSRNGKVKEPFIIGPNDTVYRYLCPNDKVGVVIGKGGENVEQLKSETKAMIKIGKTVPGCEERVITIYSSNGEASVTPAQDALFKVHNMIVAGDLGGSDEESVGQLVTVRLLVPSNQVGCIIGKGGEKVENLRNETGAQILIIKDERLPPCALRNDTLVQIIGEADVVKKALDQIAIRLQENPSPTQHLLTKANKNPYASGGALLGSDRGDKNDTGGLSHSLKSAPRDETSSKEFTIRLICPNANIGGVIGKGGSAISQIRQDWKVAVKVDDDLTKDDSLISITAKEFFEDTFSPAIEAAARVQPRCSEKVETESGIVSFTTRLLVPKSQIGCVIGKGGSVISEIRIISKANISILNGNLPEIASDDDEMVQINGELDAVKEALVRITARLRAKLFDKESAPSVLVPILPYLPVQARGSRQSRLSRKQR